MRAIFKHFFLLSIGYGLFFNPTTLPAEEQSQSELPSIQGYSVIKKLGKGDQAKVYKVVDTRQKTYALKVFYTPLEMVVVHPERRDTVLDFFEADGSSQAANAEYKVSRLINNHPAIMKIYDRRETYSEQGEKVTSLALEYIEGKNLSVLSPESLTEDEAKRCAADLASALAYAFSKGLIHNDLWSENVFIDASNHVKLIDLGSFDPLPSSRKGEKSRGKYSSYQKVVYKVIQEIFERSTMKESKQRKLLKGIKERAMTHAEIALDVESSHEIAKALQELQTYLETA